VAGHRLAAEESALEVDAEHAVEVLGVEVEEVRLDQDRGIVDQHVAVAERVVGRRHHVADVEALADVAFDVADAAERLQFLDQCGPRVVVGIGDHDAGASSRKRGRWRADALRPAGDDGDLVLEEHPQSLRSVRPRPDPSA
jgi:hypothetical protein